MTKQDLAAALTARTSLSKSQSIEAIEGLIQLFNVTLACGENIYLRGLGTFAVIERAAKKARLIKENKAVDVPAHKVVKFKPGMILKEAVK